MSDGFILVTKSKKFNRKNPRKIINNKIINTDDSSTTADLDKLIRQLEDIEADLRNSDFFEKVSQQITAAFSSETFSNIICLGIGKISEDIIAKYQLAFIKIIYELFHIKSIKFYDPVLNHTDKSILENLNFEVLKDNREGKYTVQEPTIFYLPHCPKQITNNLLYSNWNIDGLKNIILICNSFKSIIETIPERFLRPNAHYLLEINRYTKEVPIENCFKFSDIFNDFSIHSFDQLPTNSEFWTNRSEPSYSLEDLEFVKSSDGSSENVKRDIK